MFTVALLQNVNNDDEYAKKNVRHEGNFESRFQNKIHFTFLRGVE